MCCALYPCPLHFSTYNCNKIACNSYLLFANERKKTHTKPWNWIRNGKARKKCDRSCQREQNENNENTHSCRQDVSKNICFRKRIHKLLAIVSSNTVNCPHTFHRKHTQSKMGPQLGRQCSIAKTHQHQHLISRQKMSTNLSNTIPPSTWLYLTSSLIKCC